MPRANRPQQPAPKPLAQLLGRYGTDAARLERWLSRLMGRDKDVKGDSRGQKSPQK
jgi:hypothetical protein